MEQQTETLPSIKTLEAGGLSLKVTQADIVDLITAGKIQELQKEIEDFMQRATDISKIYNDYRKKVIDETGQKMFDLIKAAFSKEGTVSVEFDYSCAANSYSKPSTSITSLNNISTASQFKFEEVTRSFTLKSNVEVHFHVDAVTKDLLGNALTLRLKDKYVCDEEISLAPKGFDKLVSDYKEDVKIFLQKFQNFNYANIKRSIKAEFTKKVLEESPAEFKKSLLENFGIAI